MKYFQVILAAVFVVCFSVNISAQTTPSTSNTEDDQMNPHTLKYDMLKKIKQNIERKQGRNPDDNPDDGPNEDNGDTERKLIKPNIDSTKTNKSTKIKLPKKDN